MSETEETQIPVLYSERTDWLGNPDVETDFEKLVAYASGSE